MRVLIVKLSAIGDVVHTLPALTMLRRNVPDARITWLVEAAGAELLEGHPALDRVLVVPRHEWRSLTARHRWFAAARGFTGFVGELRRDAYDLAIDFQGLAKSGIWMRFARATRKAGFDRGLQRNEGAWLALNERIPPISIERHALERGLHLVEALGFAPQPIAYDLALGSEVVAEAARLLGELGLAPDQPFVAVNPVTRWPTKDWEATRFAAAADRLNQAGLPAVFTGAPGDRAAIDAIGAAMTTPIRRLDGRTRLKVLAEICRRARVVLSTDTGPMHIAVAVGTPVVALFGPTAPWRTGPHGESNEVLRLELPCSPCFRRRCQTTSCEPRACMLRLDPADVADAVLRRANR